MFGLFSMHYIRHGIRMFLQAVIVFLKTMKILQYIVDE